MRILVASTGFLPAESFGGLPFSTYYLCRGLVRAGADVRVVTTNTNGASQLDVATDCWTSYDGIPVWYAATRGGPFLYARSAPQVVEQSMMDAECAINSGTLWSQLGYLSWRAATRLRTPSLTYIRGLLDPWAFRHKALRKRAYWHLVGKRIVDGSAAVVALSEGEKQTLRALNVATRIEVIPNGAALEGDSGPRQLLDARYPELAGRRYVLFLGRIHAKKGMDILVQAAAGLRREAEDVRFVAAGPLDPSYAARWHDLLRAHALEGAIVTPGPVSGPIKAALFTHAAVFVLPSYSEGLPVAVLEALQAGCPVVVTKQCNLPEVEEWQAGIVIDPDAGQLLNAIRGILRDEPRRRRMAAQARTLASAVFDWDAIARRTLALCEELAASRGEMFSGNQN